MIQFNLLERILPKDGKFFFDYFDQSALISKDLANLLSKMLIEGVSEDFIKEAENLKHTAKQIRRDTIIKLDETFVTPIDREDIQFIASLLSKIARRIARSCFNLRVYGPDETTDLLKKQTTILIQGTENLVLVVASLRSITKTSVIIELNDQMSSIESYGDRVLQEAMTELYKGEIPLLNVLKLKDSYEDIEKALDHCFSVSDLIVNIALKHS